MLFPLTLKKQQYGYRLLSSGMTIGNGIWHSLSMFVRIPSVTVLLKRRPRGAHWSRRLHTMRPKAAIGASTANSLFVLHTDETAARMLHDPRMSALTGRGAA